MCIGWRGEEFFELNSSGKIYLKKNYDDEDKDHDPLSNEENQFSFFSMHNYISAEYPYNI